MSSVFDAACELLMAEDAGIGDEDVIIPVVAECDDSFLNDARRMEVGREDVAAALAAARSSRDVDWVVVADGSGGTHAGLLAGLGGRAGVLGVDVGTRPDLETGVAPKWFTAAFAAIVTAVESSEPPAFLLLGPDALALYRYTADARTSEIAKWEELTSGTNLD